jgi:hypothetical protein
MPETQAIFYRDGAGREPINDFIESLSVPAQVAIDSKIDILNGLPPHGPPLPFPHSSQVRANCANCAVTTAAPSIASCTGDPATCSFSFTSSRSGPARSQNRTSAVAEERFDDLRRRIEAVPRRPPRALGHDAPPKRRRTIA